jgi:hypothetical protein
MGSDGHGGEYRRAAWCEAFAALGNRIKMLKRQMYGRAKPDLLRKRVLLAN